MNPGASPLGRRLGLRSSGRHWRQTGRVESVAAATARKTLSRVGRVVRATLVCVIEDGVVTVAAHVSVFLAPVSSLQGANDALEARKGRFQERRPISRRFPDAVDVRRPRPPGAAIRAEASMAHREAAAASTPGPSGSISQSGRAIGWRPRLAGRLSLSLVRVAALVVRIELARRPHGFTSPTVSSA